MDNNIQAFQERTGDSAVRVFAAFLLILMCIQYIPIEGTGVSTVKVFAMIIAPSFIVVKSIKFSKNILIAFAYVITTFIVSYYINNDSFRFSTYAYLILFVLLFQSYYSLVYFGRAFSLNSFIVLLRRFILVYVLLFVIQQIFILVGIHVVPFINMVSALNRGIGSNSLSWEPSSFARVLTVLFLALLRMYELKWGKGNVTLKRLFTEDRLVLILFIWSMITMQSGTAMVGLSILMLFFVSRRNLVIIFAVLCLVIFVAEKVEYQPWLRAKTSLQAFLELDREKVIESDQSAAARIVPLVNTFTNTNLFMVETWVGKGIDFADKSEYLGGEKKIGGITDYGLIAYLLSLVIIYTCCISNLLSIESLIFIFMLGAGFSNVAYIWGCLMVLLTVKYFTTLKNSDYEQ